LLKQFSPNISTLFNVYWVFPSYVLNKKGESNFKGISIYRQNNNWIVWCSYYHRDFLKKIKGEYAMKKC